MSEEYITVESDNQYRLSYFCDDQDSFFYRVEFKFWLVTVSEEQDFSWSYSTRTIVVGIGRYIC